MKSPGVEYYSGLITSEYRLAPKFNRMVRRMAKYGTTLDDAVLKMVELFDVDTATHAQLDIIGDCVGVSRTLDFEPTLIIAGGIVCPSPKEMKGDIEPSVYDIYQTPVPARLKDADSIVGLRPAEMTDGGLINDDVFRVMVKARIIQNVWKGNVTDLYEMWRNLFPESKGLQIQDLQDMSFNIVLLGNYTAIEKELILRGYIIPKPQGVRINTLSFISTEGLPIFAYDYHTLNYSGYTSHWIEKQEE